VAHSYAQFHVPKPLVRLAMSVVANTGLMTAHINLVRSPAGFSGIAYVGDPRMLLANIGGQQQTLVGKFRVKFQQRQHPTFETAGKA
jgi:hypothetical protein